MGKISNVTNNTDPESVRSRVFVGNLNTAVLNKDDVRAIFERYGDVMAVSTHRGYAFVQYSTDESARNAVAGEDQRVYAGQEIDVNLSAEPKPMRHVRRRRYAMAVTNNNNQWSPIILPPTLSSTSLAAMTAASLLSLKHRAAASGLDMSRFSGGRGPEDRRVNGGSSRRWNRRRRNYSTTSDTVGCTRNGGAKSRDVAYKGLTSRDASGSEVEGCSSMSEQELTYDVIICGRCKSSFSTAAQLIEHRRTQLCRLRFACQCRQAAHQNTHDDPAMMTSSYVCATCRASFDTCWLLCQHCQLVHGLSIYYVTGDDVINNGNGPTSEVATSESASTMSTCDQFSDSPDIVESPRSTFDDVTHISSLDGGTRL